MSVAPGLADRSTIRALLEEDRSVHFYGLGDLADVYWDRSRWWTRHGATIGEIGLSDDPTDRVVYGINTGDPGVALELWADVDPHLPERYFATGVSGFADHLAQLGRTIELDLGQHTKMILADRGLAAAEAATDARTVCRPLTRTDLVAISELHAEHEDAGAFFSPSLLDAGPFFGCFDGRSLIAMAGVHLCDGSLNVAAIGGVLTHHDHRGRGLGRLTTASVTHALVDMGITTIGLNVTTDNHAAASIYRGLGFKEVHTYQEALLSRPPR